MELDTPSVSEYLVGKGLVGDDRVKLKELAIIKRSSLIEEWWGNKVIVATTRRNGTCSMLTSAKLTGGYLVVGIIRELDKEPSLYCSSRYTPTSWSVLQQYLLALMFMPLPHVLLLRPLCRIHVL